MEKFLGRRFGDADNPLLVSVRSGARESMPGMMDTVLNLGLNDRTVQGLIQRTNNPRFAYDSYRRFVQMYADVVLGIKPQINPPLIPLVEHPRTQKEGARRPVRHRSRRRDLQALVAGVQSEIKSQLG